MLFDFLIFSIRFEKKYQTVKPHFFEIREDIYTSDVVGFDKREMYSVFS